MGVEGKGSDSHIISEAVVEKHMDYDTESQIAPVHEEGTLKRQLKNRHIAMIRYVPSSSSSTFSPCSPLPDVVSVVSSVLVCSWVPLPPCRAEAPSVSCSVTRPLERFATASWCVHAVPTLLTSALTRPP